MLDEEIMDFLEMFCRVGKAIARSFQLSKQEIDATTVEGNLTYVDTEQTAEQHSAIQSGSLALTLSGVASSQPVHDSPRGNALFRQCDDVCPG